jgi:hypothetical protein
MGCGCRKNKGVLPARNVNVNPIRNVVSGGRNIAAPQPQQANIVPQNNAPKTNQTQAKPAIDPKVANMNINVQKNPQTTGMTKERLEIEKRRREAIRRALGK